MERKEPGAGDMEMVHSRPHPQLCVSTLRPSGTGLVVLADLGGQQLAPLCIPPRPQGPVRLVIIFSCNVQYQ